MSFFQQFIKHLAKTILKRMGVLSERLYDQRNENTNRRTLVIASVLAAVLLLPYLLFMRPPSVFPADELIEISEGMTLREIAEFLKDNQVIISPALFKVTVYALGRERDIKFGDYYFKTPVNVFRVARALSYGVYGLEPIRIRVPEGSMARDIAPMFAAHLERFNEERFLRNTAQMEGHLFPDTYFFLPNADDRLVLRTLRQSFDTHVAEFEQEITAFGRPLEDIVIMASILEREARNMYDRRMIAGVLWKRLEMDMPLQVDAVFLYSLGKATFELTSADLSSDSPYNTYRFKGLPPTAIGNPSLDSLRAAITPIENDYLFYLADRNNVTHYSKTHEEHVEKKRIYLGS